MRTKFDINLTANAEKVREIYKKLPINKLFLKFFYLHACASAQMRLHYEYV